MIALLGPFSTAAELQMAFLLFLLLCIDGMIWGFWRIWSDYHEAREWWNQQR